MEMAQFSLNDVDEAIGIPQHILSNFEKQTHIQNLFCFFPGVSSACRYYRIDVPWRTMAEQGLCQSIVDPGGNDPVNTKAAIMGSDVMLWYGMMGKSINENIDLIRGISTEEVRKHIPIYSPPIMIYDTDDNNDWVHPANPAYVSMGIRNIDGTILDPSDPEKCNIWTKDAYGNNVMIWENMVTRDPDGRLFDIARNLRFKYSRDALIKMCDGVTVSCKFLKKHMVEEIGVPEENVYVFPNCIIPEDFPKNELVEHPDEIRIVWQGGASHNADLYPIKEALEHIINKYPQVKLVVWGGDYKYFFSGIPSNRMVYHNWVGYDYYREKRSLMNADINLCPLTDNIFSRSKTAIKWYEASMLDRPEATLAAKVGPYAEEIQDGETGLLYEGTENLVEKLSVLIENAELRKKLGTNAKKWIIENCHADKHVQGLYDFYSEVRRKQILAAGVN